ncbi:PREDICTED: pentatricopeptide repeat-containing protein At2g42920, chloroplastic [Tarenaya hassleriana]|uniref:pentatricopeptide repeat-containing protein At2g42920, chloroplastic n=1 Tax=Tarenaya hassleriana TaxID=28532 RepID=UPI00053C09CC|nr:PREDICTED: pentatricopeptide repeat-containing protein At2g42920, chloroplastic [Tarenaya hassleriana]XP_010525509.1 PREDICTED: pentatricopeptide repeat-containing protein At2g42920, chloroplastic [Tarenaya hassleriana]
MSHQNIGKMASTSLCSSSPISVPRFVSDNSSVRMLDTDCTTMRDLKQVHANLIKTGSIADTVAASRVLAFCASPHVGDMNYAYLVFTRISDKNPFVWNTIIRGFSRSSSPERAISKFLDMLSCSTVQPQKLTYPSVFKACASLGHARDGKQLHGRVIKEGLDTDPFIRNTMLHMYASCGYLEEAWRFFLGMTEFDVVAWNSMIMGLAKHGRIGQSKKLFDEMPQRNGVSWNSMISGYVRNGRFMAALELFREMQVKGIKPDEFTMVSLLNACACLGASKQGKWIHDYLVRNGIELNSIVITALVDMYCKSGCIEEGFQVFRNAPNKQLSCWNSMILGLANNGFEEKALDLFMELEHSGFQPDSVSFVCVLTACAHSGMVHKADEFLRLMREKYRIEPSIKHYSCMVDLLGRAGLLEEAEALIETMPVRSDTIIWSSLLSACRKKGNVQMAERAAKCLKELDPDETCGYVLMSNAYASLGLFGEAIDQRLLMKKRRTEKEPGSSLIEVDFEVHEFVCCGRMHLKSPEIYEILNVLNWDVSALKTEVSV